MSAKFFGSYPVKIKISDEGDAVLVIPSSEVGLARTETGDVALLLSRVEFEGFVKDVNEAAKFGGAQ